MLTNDDNFVSAVASDLIWHKFDPVKVLILAWRLLCNRLPTKVNLLVRGIITQEAQMCVTGCGNNATFIFLVSHL